jgi:hypothetical protein
MKYGFLLAVVIILGPLRAEAAPAGVAAKVNGDIILKADLDHQVDEWFTDSDLQGVQLQAARKERREEALGALISRDLVLQAFRDEGGQVPNGEIDRRLEATIAENYGGDRNAFLSTIKERGVTPEKYRNEIAENWIVGYMRQKHTAPDWPRSLLAHADIVIY